jgi:hypothetical protein
MSSNVGKKCFKLWCVLCAVQCTAHSTHCLYSIFRDGNEVPGHRSHRYSLNLTLVWSMSGLGGVGGD